MASSSMTLVFLVLVTVSLQSGLACRYYCRDPVKAVYHCCDDGNPYTTTTSSPAGEAGDVNTTTDGEQGSDDDGTNTRGTAVVTSLVVEEYGPEDGAKYNESSSCRYYCAYANSVYCCDDGSLKMPEDHDSNHGRCPSLLEQICKEDAIYLHQKTRKMETTISGSDFLSKIGDEAVMCASDGYCAEDERCCPTPCHKRHVCLKSVVLDKSKN